MATLLEPKHAEANITVTLPVTCPFLLSKFELGFCLLTASPNLHHAIGIIIIPALWMSILKRRLKTLGSHSS